MCNIFLSYNTIKLILANQKYSTKGDIQIPIPIKNCNLKMRIIINFCLALTYQIVHSSPGYFFGPRHHHQTYPAFSKDSNNANNASSNNVPSSASAPKVNVGSEREEFFDLSYTYDNSTFFLPGQRFTRFHLLMNTSTTRRTPDNYEYAFAEFSTCFSEHGGTHIDAPFHFNRNGWKVHEIPLSRLVNIPTALIDIEHHVFALSEPDQFSLEVRHLQEHESRFGQIPRGALIFIHFGWAKRFWPDPRRYSGLDNSTARVGGPQFTFRFPAISGNAASWLLKERKIVGIGTDTMSPDVVTTNPVVHILLLENQVYILENVANLDYMGQRLRQQQLSNCDLRTYVLPIKSMGTGGPVRLVSYCKH